MCLIERKKMEGRPDFPQLIDRDNLLHFLDSNLEIDRKVEMYSMFSYVLMVFKVFLTHVFIFLFSMLERIVLEYTLALEPDGSL